MILLKISLLEGIIMTIITIGMIIWCAVIIDKAIKKKKNKKEDIEEIEVNEESKK